MLAVIKICSPELHKEEDRKNHINYGKYDIVDYGLNLRLRRVPCVSIAPATSPAAKAVIEKDIAKISTTDTQKSLLKVFDFIRIILQSSF